MVGSGAPTTDRQLAGGVPARADLGGPGGDGHHRARPPGQSGGAALAAAVGRRWWRAASWSAAPGLVATRWAAASIAESADVIGADRAGAERPIDETGVHPWSGRPRSARPSAAPPKCGGRGAGGTDRVRVCRPGARWQARHRVRTCIRPPRSRPLLERERNATSGRCQRQVQNVPPRSRPVSDSDVRRQPSRFLRHTGRRRGQQGRCHVLRVTVEPDRLRGRVGR